MPPERCYGNFWQHPLLGEVGCYGQSHHQDRHPWTHSSQSYYWANSNHLLASYLGLATNRAELLLVSSYGQPLDRALKRLLEGHSSSLTTGTCMWASPNNIIIRALYIGKSANQIAVSWDF